MDPETEVGPLISPSQRDRVLGYIHLGQSETAKLVCGGDVPTDPARARGSYLMPAVLANVGNRMRVAQEEIFGPVLCVIPFRDEEEAVRLANDTIYGLSPTRDVGRAIRARRSDRCLSVNCTSAPEAPFASWRSEARPLTLYRGENYVPMVGSRRPGTVRQFGCTARTMTVRGSALRNQQRRSTVRVYECTVVPRIQ
jgi:hypothetical protein